MPLGLEATLSDTYLVSDLPSRLICKQRKTMRVFSGLMDSLPMVAIEPMLGKGHSDPCVPCLRIRDNGYNLFIQLLFIREKNSCIVGTEIPG
jgi:hypothetical protein